MSLSGGDTGSPALQLEVAAAAAPGTYRWTAEGSGCSPTRCGVPVRLDLVLTVRTVAGATARGEYDEPSADRMAERQDYGLGPALADEAMVTLAAGSGVERATAAANGVGAVVTTAWVDADIYVLRWATPVDVPTYLARLRAEPGVVAAEPSLFNLDATGHTDDAGFPTDWSWEGSFLEWAGSTPTWRDRAWPDLMVRATPARKAYSPSAGVAVGVIDGNGVFRHSDLRVRGDDENSISDSDPEFTSVARRHATHVAGIACAEQDGRGVVGIAAGCPVVAESSWSHNVGVVANAIWLARGRGDTSTSKVRVVNISMGPILGHEGCQTSEDRARMNQLSSSASASFRRVASGIGKNIVWTVSAGNQCARGANSAWGFASDLPNVISVASVNEDGQLSSFSNYGTNPDHPSARVEVAAPGGTSDASPQGGVWSDGYRSCLFSHCTSYWASYGTSMAAPVVAGIAQLAFSAQPGLTADQIGNCIVSSTTRAVTLRSSNPAGFDAQDFITVGDGLGIVDAVASTQCAAATVSLVDPIVPTSERTALLELYDATGGASWTRTEGWSSNTTVCSWSGVQCQDGHVTRLNLSGQQLVGRVPDSLVQLTALTDLDLSFNQLGAIPEVVTSMVGLRALNVSAMGLTSLPVGIGRLSALTTLTARYNSLVGLPSAIGDVSALQSLYLSNNVLRSVPDTLANLKRLTRLEMTQNFLDTVPVGITRLPGLQELRLDANDLSSLPDSIMELTSLRVLILSGNDLTSLPATVSRLVNLTDLYVVRNHLKSLPASVGALKRLSWLALEQNELSGDISSWAAPLKVGGRLSVLSLSDGPGHNHGLTAGTDPALSKWLALHDPRWNEAT